ncbi:MAG TPA: LLM class F420-dependent oxidoreductase [Mycobacteriales bacterium]|nr:LLM class F420-dependent oxidoreductase [Mycobacteriales bacterium]
MKYDVILPASAGTTADPQWVAGFATHVEACGFDGLVVVEHSVVVRDYDSAYPYSASGRMELEPGCDVPDPLDLLAYLAGLTDRIALATGVLVLPNHHPVVLAKRAATVDALSAGRLRLCVGMGWMREEIEACGVAFETRGRRADEQLAVLRLLWEGDDTGVDHDGEFFQLRRAVSFPKPAHRIGVHVGGHSLAAARRAGRYGDGLQPLGVKGEELHALVSVMREEAAACGRDPEALELTLGHLVPAVTLDKAERLAALGADRLVLAASPLPDLDAARDELSACAERLGLS